MAFALAGLFVVGLVYFVVHRLSAPKAPRPSTPVSPRPKFPSEEK